MGSIVSLTSNGDFKKTNRFLTTVLDLKIESILDFYGAKGVELLASQTPVRTGRTASSWSYEKDVTNTSITLTWVNNSVGDDGKTPVVILIIKGHGTRTGGYVAPNDFVTPIVENLFREAADAVWRAVKSS